MKINPVDGRGAPEALVEANLPTANWALTVKKHCKLCVVGIVGFRIHMRTT